MLTTAGKYTNVRAAASRQRPRRSTGGSTTGRRPIDGAPAILIPHRAKLINMREWFWRELRDGRLVRRMLEREKHQMPQLIREVARREHGTKANPKSDFELLATVPARLYHRWKKEDPDFWSDDSNLKRLKRDNPDLPVYIR